MVKWHVTTKLFPTKCHERATLQKLWHQMRISSLLLAKCWPLLYVIRGGLMLLLEYQHVFKICFCFALLNNKSLNDWSLGEQWNFVSSNHNVFSGNKIHCSPQDQSLSVLHCTSLLRMIYGVISACSCTRTLKTWRICLDIELCQLKNGYSTNEHGTPPFFPVIVINLS